MSGTFFYFAYGSNLLAQRIHINNPSAIRAGIGKLKDFQLDFLTYSRGWKGCSATIVKNPGKHVWGAIWEIDLKHLESLDNQEGVKHGFYFARDVAVELPEGGTKKCRVYEQCKTPKPTENLANLEEERRPSYIYLKTIQNGAKESGLPEDYQRFLLGIPDNGYKGDADIGAKLDLTA